MNFERIKSKNDYEMYLNKINSYMDKENLSVDEEFELSILTFIIEEYEKTIFNVSEKTDPISMIKFAMENRNLSAADLVPFIGSRSKVSEVLLKRRPLSINMIRSLSKGLDIPVELLIDEYELDTPEPRFWKKIKYKKINFNIPKQPYSVSYINSLIAQN